MVLLLRSLQRKICCIVVAKSTWSDYTSQQLNASLAYIKILTGQIREIPLRSEHCLTK